MLHPVRGRGCEVRDRLMPATTPSQSGRENNETGFSWVLYPVWFMAPWHKSRPVPRQRMAESIG